MTKYDIKQSGDGGVRVIGFVDWSPEDWDYQTSVAEVERLLAEVCWLSAQMGQKVNGDFELILRAL